MQLHTSELRGHSADSLETRTRTQRVTRKSNLNQIRHTGTGYPGRVLKQSATGVPKSGQNVLRKKPEFTDSESEMVLCAIEKSSSVCFVMIRHNTGPLVTAGKVCAFCGMIGLWPSGSTVRSLIRSGVKTLITSSTTLIIRHSQARTQLPQGQ